MTQNGDSELTKKTRQQGLLKPSAISFTGAQQNTNQHLISNQLSNQSQHATFSKLPLSKINYISFFATLLFKPNYTLRSAPIDFHFTCHFYQLTSAKVSCFIKAIRPMLYGIHQYIYHSLTWLLVLLCNFNSFNNKEDSYTESFSKHIESSRRRREEL